EIDRQLDAFEQVARRAPDFVDGHRHVHQLPLVRQALVHALEQRYPPGLPWLRSTAPGAGSLGPATGLKAAVIHALGGRALDGLATAAGLQQNRRLLGVYGFHGDAQAHERRLASWLSASKDGDLLMCHTALPAHAESGDPIALARKVEHQVLSGERFKRLLDDFHILVTRFERAC
ncbi:MAG TPA: ChbG/HpnK family deacetylase, partial [Burkholderiaceae bacterium]|nr:ChbG/HpnK family deacetylase [Burkholderiaceae bacterium]